MKRANEEYTTAINGLEALHKYQAEHQSIKVIFMGMKPISSVNVPNLSLLKFDLWKRVFSGTSRLVESSLKQWNFDCSDQVGMLEKSFKCSSGTGDIQLMYVIDVAMPVKDGITATKEIRQFEREASLPRVRIAVLTCFSSAEYQKNAFAAGADLFLIKPVQMKALKPILEMDPEVVVPR
jgi:CheY-like chemotaxis protein